MFWSFNHAVTAEQEHTRWQSTASVNRGKGSARQLEHQKHQQQNSLTWHIWPGPSATTDARRGSRILAARGHSALLLGGEYLTQRHSGHPTADTAEQNHKKSLKSDLQQHQQERQHHQLATSQCNSTHTQLPTMLITNQHRDAASATFIHSLFE